MSLENIQKELQHITKTPGVVSCALVVIDTGMVLLNTSQDESFEIIAEGARDYWTVQDRNGGIFKAIGDINVIFVFHQQNIISIQMCDDKTLLITLAETKGVDWNKWQRVIAPLKNKIKDLEGKK